MTYAAKLRARIARWEDVAYDAEAYLRAAAPHFPRTVEAELAMAQRAIVRSRALLRAELAQRVHPTCDGFAVDSIDESGNDVRTEFETETEAREYAAELRAAVSR